MSRTQHPLFEQPWPEGEYRLFQLGHVVDDVVSAAATWARVFGIGPSTSCPSSSSGPSTEASRQP